ncbi:MAG: ATP phosphoribosyltransferase regulatory subunit [Helicobacteraceae bacterium]|jgi:histidyl-tRNA synthetase|nr:ATP phosphoribosyltransferase regulatory subunit [Helicobacteraceae bacterium]
MIGEYEIPKGSKLFFGDRARKKREIENKAAALFEKRGFEEIAAPLFSYHQANLNETIRFSDEDNNAVFLRADSSLEAVRLILKRLGRATEHRKWFYIQPVFRYPTREIHQIGAEAIGQSDLKAMISLCGEILDAVGLRGATLQAGSIALLNALQKLLGIDREVLIRHELHKLLERDEKWLKPLAELCDPKRLDEVLAIVPNELKPHLKAMGELARGRDRVALSPLFYADMAYYDDLYFRFLLNGKQIAMGGGYESGEGRAVGFAIYTDELIDF